MAHDYNKDLTIDPQALDIEWLKQPRLYMRYAEELVNAKDKRDRQAERVDIAKAEADARVRARFAAGNEKVTVDMVRAAVQQDAEVQSETDRLLSYEHEVGILGAAVKAFDMRKDALENMVRLHGQQYFAGPTVPRNIGEEFQKQIAENNRIESRDRIAGRRRS